jgi:hypothetical protein
MQKSIVFLYPSKEKSEWKFRKEFHYIKRTKYFEINLAKEVQALYTEKYKMLLKENLKDTNKWIMCAHDLKD